MKAPDIVRDHAKEKVGDKMIDALVPVILGDVRHPVIPALIMATHHVQVIHEALADAHAPAHSAVDRRVPAHVEVDRRVSAHVAVDRRDPVHAALELLVRTQTKVAVKEADADNEEFNFLNLYERSFFYLSVGKSHKFFINQPMFLLFIKMQLF